MIRYELGMELALPEPGMVDIGDGWTRESLLANVLDQVLRDLAVPYELRLILRRPEVLDLPRPAPRGPHDLHRGRARRGLHGPHVRHQATLRATPGAQVQLS